MNNQLERVPVLVTAGVNEARTAVGYQPPDSDKSKTHFFNKEIRRTWYEKALDGTKCAQFFVGRIDRIIKADKIVEDQFKIVFEQWLKVPSVYRALTTMATVKMVQNLYIPIGYYPQLVDRIKEECINRIRK